MIQTFVQRFDAKRDWVKEQIVAAPPRSYRDVVSLAIRAVTADEYSAWSPDPDRIHQIDDGDYQGTLVFVIGEKGYQPSTYYVVKVDYGSCSGCDTLQGICDDSDEPLSPQQVEDYFTLVLHVVQGLRETGEAV